MKKKQVSNYSFKKALSKFATGITIITINSKNEFIGKTVNSFASLSLNPPLVLFSLDKKSSSLKKFLESKYIGINILSKKQKNISQYFSNKKETWGDTNFILSKENIPLIKNSVVNLSCKTFKKLPNGDHVIFICKVVSIKIDKSLKPLIYLNNKYY
ncbi:MAG: p-hydroxyphenylacetate 3-hydroxylase, reductase component [Alphaproteobacteria bacterium MarineAlpha5_Bin8]|nr:MAG: p-hydroxyphenylacetate 3-hydroxylase, reductase component [Alphaproteobacteria bacterium MarineAlpha5_Bin7]PPR44254.1 MAG: p-hydroxyphenylacetate 3-hydroxylase, reductase component [Alphaproteobacteria bacterium MarineAlpha5_Bin8]PPR52875.1 MAG: p-hydroxyphenylacetate 3-hydroxylase, reductase component [Alphaproteobacteria bacterium MarineAlpha5_Bin6]|tara:strand:+ start:842 stop:1312 length:471 start_codon:yes stop_codon:yes gene_type:complete